MFIDIFCLLILGTSFYLGYSKGIIKSIFGILSIVLGFLISIKFSFLSIGLVEKILDVDPRLNIVIGFVFTFLVVMIGIRLIGQGFEKILETAHINFINQLAGGLVTSFIAMLLFSSIVTFADSLKLIKSSVKSESLTYTYLQAIPSRSKWLIDKTKPIFSEFWEKTNNAIDKVNKKHEEQQHKPESI
jgi:membrane protein required for colicin V production